MQHRSRSTPWGPSQDARQIAEGITLYSTASHGGFRVDKDARQRMPKALRVVPVWAGPGWYEEDCDAALVMVAFPDLFPPRTVAYAIQSVRQWHAQKFNVNAFFASPAGHTALARAALDPVDAAIEQTACADAIAPPPSECEKTARV